MGTMFSEVKVGNVTLKNRIMTSGHQTTLVHKHLPNEDFFAYHLERAKGGTGLVVLEAHGTHETGLNTAYAIDATNPEIVELYTPFLEQMKSHGTTVFAQLIHHGREAYLNDNHTVPVAPSAIKTERFHIIPRELECEEISEIIEGFVISASHLAESGINGLELVGSHAYLFGQFWNERTNQRTDQWGGSFENRLRFAKEVITRVKEEIGDDIALGMRISLDSGDHSGTCTKESLEVISYLHQLGLLDYWSLVIGSSATYIGSSYIVPPSNNEAQHLFKDVKLVREIIGKEFPLMITSRIYEPKTAEDILSLDEVDVVGMTRALIADPHLPNKVFQNEEDTIIPCIACNQGCIGRYQQHLPIRCTVNPRTGREKDLPLIQTKIEEKRRILVIGGGAAGMTAAITARKNGHHVVLVEQQNNLGGQLSVIEKAPFRHQDQKWKKYLVDQVKKVGIQTKLGKRFYLKDITSYQVDEVILATGSVPYVPMPDTNVSYGIRSSWEAMTNPPKGKKTFIFDWKGEREALEVAELLAQQGNDVTIVSNTYGIGDHVQSYLRNQILARLDHLNVHLLPNYNWHQFLDDSIVIKNIFSHAKIEHKVEEIIMCTGRDSSQSLSLYRELKNYGVRVTRVGDALSPRDLDQNIFEAYKLGNHL
ncbi:hypothetical protein DH09_11710 [Bacillaceae bacterium JMAK1]|nr:hypothetical protein DH09_11710 [Bacillaceae bacterium JMAK1]